MTGRKIQQKLETVVILYSKVSCQSFCCYLMYLHEGEAAVSATEKESVKKTCVEKVLLTGLLSQIYRMKDGVCNHKKCNQHYQSQREDDV